MIKDLTKSTGMKPAALKNYTNQQLDMFINQKVEQSSGADYSNRMVNPPSHKKIESTPRNKDNSSYLNEKTVDTTFPKNNLNNSQGRVRARDQGRTKNQNTPTQGKIQGHLQNFLKDSKGMMVSTEVPRRQNLNLSRPLSSKKIFTGASNTRNQSRAGSAGNTLLRSNNFDPDRSSDLIRSTNKSFEDNIKALEYYINEIKLRGFEKVRREVEQKQRIIKALQLEVDSLQKKVNFTNSQRKHFGTKNSKFQSEMNMYREISERCHRDIYFMYKEMPAVKREIEEMNVELSVRVKETKLIYTIISEEEREINIIKEEIRKLNKRNSDIEKEKESYRNGIALLKKHISVIKDKIKGEDEKSREFMLNVSSFVNKSLCD